MNIYRTEFVVLCPVNGKKILYRLEIKTNKMIRAEAILEETNLFVSEFHEAIADKLSEKFEGLQKLEANHHGVNITTIRP